MRILKNLEKREENLKARVAANAEHANVAYLNTVEQHVEERIATIEARRAAHANAVVNIVANTVASAN